VKFQAGPVAGLRTGPGDILLGPVPGPVGALIFAAKSACCSGVSAARRAARSRDGLVGLWLRTKPQLAPHVRGLHTELVRLPVLVNLAPVAESCTRRSSRWPVHPSGPKVMMAAGLIESLIGADRDLREVPCALRAIRRDNEMRLTPLAREAREHRADDTLVIGGVRTRRRWAGFPERTTSAGASARQR
jgi:hypothetical protein